eukprot:TRINITY_DN51288_c0_g1_i1.p1 TRINITY_DN51288_c0_g1~~TRINITY_DN51288_c0_g1_i1.p1  ORF type:complete len:305 (-),score=84.89 TRINITY_DN51288_c0_g1_i1:97-1011(-)
MKGVWKEDGSFEAAKGEFKRMKTMEKGMKAKGKGKGKLEKGKGKTGIKGMSDLEAARLATAAAAESGEPDAKKPRLDDDDGFDFEEDWKDKLICLVNLKAASLNGVYGNVKEHLGVEKVMIDGKEKKIRRFLVTLEDGKGEKSIKFENLFKVVTGSLVKLRGLDTAELNDSIAECGRLDAATMRYDVTLSDGRHIKVKPSNAEFYAQYETNVAAGEASQMEWMKDCNSLKDRLWVLEEYGYPVPQVLPAKALEDYATKFPKSVVIGKSNAANPKGVQVLVRELTICSGVRDDGNRSQADKSWPL